MRLAFFIYVPWEVTCQVVRFRQLVRQITPAQLLQHTYQICSTCRADEIQVMLLRQLVHVCQCHSLLTFLAVHFHALPWARVLHRHPSQLSYRHGSIAILMDEFAGMIDYCQLLVLLCAISHRSQGEKAGSLGEQASLK
jgi:hypothetical protein